jgi:sulfate adenylyltransferase subunit 1
MDDSELTEGKNYFVKLGTKLLPGIVTEVKYKIDVNTGEHIKANSLTKNEIAVCSISLSEKIVVDKFKVHKTLGELILIDRITNMTSACGVVEDIASEEKKIEGTVFQYNGLSARGDIFEEFYYNFESMSVSKHKPEQRVYTVGDEIPVKGESYHYPENFDVLVLRDHVAVEIRDKKISDIQSIDDYRYSGNPITNGRGFAIHADSKEAVGRFLKEYQEKDHEEKQEGDVLNKWLNFDTYRRIIFHSNYWEI